MTTQAIAYLYEYDKVLYIGAKKVPTVPMDSSIPEDAKIKHHIVFDTDLSHVLICDLFPEYIAIETDSLIYSEQNGDYQIEGYLEDIILSMNDVVRDARDFHLYVEDLSGSDSEDIAII
jgi:hypothetical protein